MSCMSCHLCTCSLTTETKTQLIIYAHPPISSSNKNNSYKVRRTNREQSMNMNMNMNRQSSSKNVSSSTDKNNETADDTISKFKSASSSQIIKENSTSVQVQQEINRKQQIPQESNKQNEQRNCCQSRLTMDLHSKLSPKKKASQSEIFQLKSVCLSAKSMRLSQAAMLSMHSSSATEKRLQTILLEKENDQLRDQLQRLKLKQKQLLKQQQRVKDKSNREICHLKQRSQELQIKSITRRKQLDQLKDLLQIVKRGNN